ncbi:MAG: N-6 DNA methylase [Rhodocyclaceae bacterium]|nr:N-6 DNA methylase [Rhodocyclaceae bacterium]
MHPLSKPLRSRLEATIKTARDVAETAARDALEYLGVGEPKAPAHLTPEQAELRRRLRLHGRQLGDVKLTGDKQDIRHLVWEVAYEHWHRMLFARFLAENHLLMHPDGVAVSLADCNDLAKDEGASDGWELAGRYAARMLPQVFRKDAPALQVQLAPNDLHALAKLVSGLDPDTFRASDSLGWVYQFWQAKRKDEVNASEVKIGADELPAVTQLFTEPYMVAFLLHNSLGAWWETRQKRRHPGEPCPVDLEYLRTLEDGTPAAGKFDGWPDTLKDFKLLDPCCGSGHFIVAAFHLLVPMRMQAESLSASEAVDAVIADNLHGLEIDPRCVEIAAFALALAAWSYPDAGGYRVLPALNIACCGLKVSAKADDWAALVPDDAPHATLLRQDLKLLHASMREAPLLGSLLDPWGSLRNDLATSDYAGLQAMLSTALTQERVGLLSDSEDLWDAAVSAQGLLDAARILAQRYHLVITNVPYLARGRQSDHLKDFCEAHFSNAQQDLANVFVERSLELLNPGGICSAVTPQNWLFRSRYKAHREQLLKETTWRMLARLGPGAFESISGHVVQAVLVSLEQRAPTKNDHLIGVDASQEPTPTEKASHIRSCALHSVLQDSQLRSPGCRITLFPEEGSLLDEIARGVTGLITKDAVRFYKSFWEPRLDADWEYGQSSVSENISWGGLSLAVFWQQDKGVLREQYKNGISILAGGLAWGRKGVCVSQTGQLPAALYSGALFDDTVAVVVPENPEHVAAIWACCESGAFGSSVRKINQALKVTPSTLVKVGFDVAHWQQVAAERYPNGLPKPYSDDPTQWIFHGHPKPATDPLQVAIARLLGYQWPAETDADMELSDEARAWIAESAKLAALADDDGIACIPPVRGEKPAAERLLDLLIAAWGADWQAGTLDKLLAQADCAGKSLDFWLRERFFEQHCKRFQHRPFIWHVWDGLKDGFAALVNYHKLDRKNLETLIYTYLGDWIRTQERGTRGGVDGADLRLAAAQALKTKLEKILEGEAPYDIFVRWKPLDQQPIGWDPDLNDGVRLNIRPFMTAEVLRHNKKPKLNIAWDKDRGKDVESAPWFKTFKGDRINDHHLTLAEKRAARGMS